MAASFGAYMCHVCYKTYTRADHLTRHSRSHTREKPFVCKICAKSFARRDLLTRHSGLHRSDGERQQSRRDSRGQRSRFACVACASAKLRCGDSRPCLRCTAKGIQCQSPPAAAQSNQQSDSSVDQPSGSFAASESLTPSAFQGLWTSQSEPRRFLEAAAAEDISAMRVHGSTSDLICPNFVGTAMPSLQAPIPVSETSQPEHEVYDDTFDLRFDMVGDFDEDLMSAFLHDIIDSEQINDSQITRNDIHLDVLHYGFDEFNAHGMSRSERVAASLDETDSAANLADRDYTPTCPAGTEMPSVRRAVREAEQAFRESLWLWDPSIENGTVSEQINFNMLRDPSITDVQLSHASPGLTLSIACRDRLLSMILGTGEPLVQRKVVSSFPSHNFLSSLLVDFKIRHSCQISPWIHFPTLDLENECEEFIAAMICAGAADSKRPEVRKLGFAMQEAVRLAMTKRIEDDSRQRRDLHSSQALLLILNVGLNSASRRKIEIAEAATLSMVTMLRRGGRFRSEKEIPPRFHESSSDHDGTLEVQWKRWVEEESFKRLAYHVLFQDVQTSSALFRQPTISTSEVNLAMPCSAEVWEASSPETWREALLRQCQSVKQSDTRPQLPQYLQDPSLLSQNHAVIDVQMSLRVVASIFYLRAWQFQQLNASFTSPGNTSSLNNFSNLRQQLVSDSQDLLVRFANGPAPMHPCVQAFLELSTMQLHVSLEDIQQLAGKEGEQQARLAAARLRLWVSQRTSRQALFHAGQIAKTAVQCPLDYLRGYHAIIVYQAALVMWTYALLATRQPGSQVPPQGLDERSENTLPVIDLDGDETPEVKRFILLGEGMPCIKNYYQGTECGNASEVPKVKLTNATEIMLSMAGLLANRYRTESYCIPIAGYLTKLMHLLAQASSALKQLR